MDLLVGVSLAVHNNRELVRQCLACLKESRNVKLHVVVVDDGSSDGTCTMLEKEFPNVTILRGNGNLWWTGATNWGCRVCLDAGCDYVVLLNPDVIVEPNTIELLVTNSRCRQDAIVAPVVLNFDNPSIIWEAGHSWKPVFSWFPLFRVSRYLYKHGTSVANIPETPYETVSVVGRGGLFPRKAFQKLGYFDEKKLPQYGADADMSLRAYYFGYPMYIVPTAKVLMHVEQTGRNVKDNFRDAIIQYWQYLTSRKHGEALRVLYHYNMNNLPSYIAIPNYIFMLTLNTFRYWQEYFYSIFLKFKKGAHE